MILVSLWCVVPAFAYAADLPAGQAGAAIQIDQVSPADYGTWTFLFSDGEAKAGRGEVGKPSSESFSVSYTGSVTLATTLPAGMAAKIDVYKSGMLLKTIDLPQVAIELQSGDDYRFVIRYSYSRLGTLGITSEPNHGRFVMKGPTRRRFTGRTPKTYLNIPEGHYVITFRPLPGCVSPAPKTIIVEPNKRNVAKITIPCESKENESVQQRTSTKRSIMEAARLRELKPIGERK